MILDDGSFLENTCSGGHIHIVFSRDEISRAGSKNLEVELS